MVKLRQKTTPPQKYVVLYDGHCQFCTKQVRNLVALARSGVLDAVSFQDASVLARFPGLTHEACMQAMHLVTPDGSIYRGFEAAVRAMLTRPLLGLFAYGYYLPGIRQLFDRLYAYLAARRYRLLPPDECPGRTCSLHGLPQSDKMTR
jgi:predicted DCC family thiol-disulfide oxidoreductase YuxK